MARAAVGESPLRQTFANGGASGLSAGRDPASAEAAASRIRLNGGALKLAQSIAGELTAARLYAKYRRASGDNAYQSDEFCSEGIANEGKLSLALPNRVRDHHVNLFRFRVEERLRVRGV